jgi:hypothetical protein
MDSQLERAAVAASIRPTHPGQDFKRRPLQILGPNLVLARV